MDEAALGAFLADVGVLDFAEQAALDYAQIRADFAKERHDGRRQTICSLRRMLAASD